MKWLLGSNHHYMLYMYFNYRLLEFTTCKQDAQEFPATIEKQYIDHIKKAEMLRCFVYYKINEG